MEYSIPTNQTLQEYEALGLSEEDAYKFWHLGLDPYTISCWTRHSLGAIVSDITFSSPVYGIPISIKQAIPSPKRPKRQLTVSRLLNG